MSVFPRTIRVDFHGFCVTAYVIYWQELLAQPELLIYVPVELNFGAVDKDWLCDVLASYFGRAGWGWACWNPAEKDAGWIILFNEMVYWSRVWKIAECDSKVSNEYWMIAGPERVPKVRIDLVAYIRKWETMPSDRSDRRSDKGLPTNLNSVLPVPLSRKPSKVHISSLGRDRSPV
jgi:hypothetical protein